MFIVRKRLSIILLSGFLLFLVLISRLGYIQLINGNILSQRAEDLWSRDIPFAAKRGSIYDRNGEVLAYNISVPSVLVIPAQVKDPANTAKQLANILEVKEEDIYKLITKRELMVKIPKGRRISEEKAKRIIDLKLPGVIITEETKRFYPNNNLAAHLLGIVGIENQGLTGIELYYDQLLRGKNGAISFYSTAKSEKMINQPYKYTAPVNGYDLYLTIDKQIQIIIERELDNAIQQYQPDQAIAIAMDPKTGEVLAIASRPDFEPSNYQNYPSDSYNRILPIWMAYEPGSTFKIITLAAALEEKKVNLNESFFDPGYIIVAGERLNCWKREGHGHQTFLEVVENSCNPGFVTLGLRLGKETLFQYIKDFGFGEKTGIDLKGEARGILFKLDKVGPVELATTSFGQGVAVTPIQQVNAVSAAINGGKLLTPYLLKEARDANGQLIIANNPKVVREVISEATSKQVRLALESVVANGTGRNAYVEGYRVGGKTGTAQKVGPNGNYLPNNHIVSFIGFAPADDPQIIVYVAIDNPKGIQFGGVVAAPIVGNIIEDVMQYLKVAVRQNQIPKEYRYGDTPYVEVPNLIGETISDIQRDLYIDFSLKIEGKGEKIIEQLPKPGTRILKGSTIQIYLGDKKDSGD